MAGEVWDAPNQQVVRPDESPPWEEGNGAGQGGTPATGAVAGTPGIFTPGGSDPPADLAGMAGLTATPATAWTPGQHVIPGDGSHCHWDGTAWAAGDAAVAAEPDDADLDGMTKNELLDEAERRDLDVSSSMTKDELKEAIRGA